MLRQNVPQAPQRTPIPLLKLVSRPQGQPAFPDDKVPTFSHELPPVRFKERMVWSLILHALGLLLLVQLARWFPMPGYIETSNVSVTPLYLPKAPPPPVVVRKVEAPPVRTLAKITPPKIELPPPPVEKPPAPQPEPPKPQPKIEKPAETFASAPPVKPEPPKREVITNTFASGSSAPPTVHKPEPQVQTGGFGDPNGVRGTSDAKRTVTIANVGSFDLPSGAGKGNGAGGTHGTPGTVASAGFGDGVAGPGNGDHARGPVTSAGFGNMIGSAGPKARTETKPETTPVEILYKPKPVYTTEARQLKIQGEVLVQVMFGASGSLQINGVTRGLGHGLDEAALHAAQLIKFRPAMRDGHPYDSNGIVHIIFELAE
jgi:TonB family protein